MVFHEEQYAILICLSIQLHQEIKTNLQLHSAALKEIKEPLTLEGLNIGSKKCKTGAIFKDKKRKGI
jgi:hypothetical protein